jgi:hypothetical protein
MDNLLLEEDPVITDLKFRLQNNGKPIPMMPMGDMDFLIDE